MGIRWCNLYDPISKTGEARLQASSCMHMLFNEAEEQEWSALVYGTE